jgi:hypothetical protein
LIRNYISFLHFSSTVFGGHYMLPYTSSVIESTIETLVNTRHKKKHKAQWSREGAHNILQIRSSRASNKWDQEWSQAKQKFYIPKTKVA